MHYKKSTQTLNSTLPQKIAYRVETPPPPPPQIIHKITDCLFLHRFSKNFPMEYSAQRGGVQTREHPKKTPLLRKPFCKPDIQCFLSIFYIAVTIFWFSEKVLRESRDHCGQWCRYQEKKKGLLRQKISWRRQTNAFPNTRKHIKITWPRTKRQMPSSPAEPLYPFPGVQKAVDPVLWRISNFPGSNHIPKIEGRSKGGRRKRAKKRAKRVVSFIGK